MPIKHPAHTLIALILLMLLSACGGGSNPPANNGTPAEVFSLATVGVDSGTVIPTLTDAQSTASVATPSGDSQPADQSRSVVCQPTEPDGEGPYFIEGAPVKANIAPDGAAGEPLVISGIVYAMTAAGCQPLAGAVIDVWQTDANGEYDLTDQFLYRGKVESDAQGRYTITTILPAAYEGRPRHIHIRVVHPDAATLTTQFYFEGDPVLDGLTHADSPRILVLSGDSSGYTSIFDFVLSGN